MVGGAFFFKKTVTAGWWHLDTTDSIGGTSAAQIVEGKTACVFSKKKRPTNHPKAGAAAPVALICNPDRQR